MKTNLSKLFSLTLTAAAMALTAQGSLAVQSGAQNASPFGLEVGSATCDAARAKLGSTNEKKLNDSDVVIYSNNPSNLYNGASEAFVRCSNNRIIAVQFTASKGGMGSPSARETYSGLSKKYKLVSGGPMPQLGDGYARFAIGGSIIEQSAPHLSFDFTVTYFDKNFYDGIVASTKAEEKKSKESKQSSL